MKHQRVCILGGTGFVGHHLANRLSSAGVESRILARRPERHRDLCLAQGVELRQANIFDRTALVEQLQDCSAVINLIGILNEGTGTSFQRLHVDLIDLILDAAGSAGVTRYLHMSALHANTEGSSAYLRTKGEGEAHALGRGGTLGVTSFRPSVIFGRGDGFFNRFATLLKTAPGVIPLACPNARFAPVYVDDVTKAMAIALGNPQTIGQCYDLCGPRIFTLRELVDYTAQRINKPTRIIGLNNAASRLQAKVFQLLPGKPFTMDNYLSLQTDSICETSGLAELGIQATDIETVVPTYLR